MTVVPIPGHPGQYARPELVAAWQAAGSPPFDSATRLYDEQKELYDGWRAGWGGYNPADDPDDESQQLGHVRGCALDITPTPDRVRRLEAAGLVRPFSWEPWHWALPGDLTRFPTVHEYPNPTEEDMPLNADTDYEAFAAMLQRALKYDVRPLGRGATGTLGPTIFEQLDRIPARVWDHEIQAQDENGRAVLKDGKPVRFRAHGFLASTNAALQSLLAKIGGRA